MKAYEVEVSVDGENIRVYLVWAMNETHAENIACAQVKNLIRGSARHLRFPESVAEIDYDGVLGLAPHRSAQKGDA
jgi:hypothetical protein